MERSDDSLFGLAPAEMARNLSPETRVAVLSQILCYDKDGGTSWQSFEQNDGTVVGLAAPSGSLSRETTDRQYFNVLLDDPIVDDETDFPTGHPMIVDGRDHPVLLSELGPVTLRNIVAALPE